MQEHEYCNGVPQWFPALSTSQQGLPPDSAAFGIRLSFRSCFAQLCISTVQGASIPRTTNKGVGSFMQPSSIGEAVHLLPYVICLASKTQVVCIWQCREANPKVLKVWSPQRMITSKTSQIEVLARSRQASATHTLLVKTYIVQEHHVAWFVVWIKPASSIGD